MIKLRGLLCAPLLLGGVGALLTIPVEAQAGTVKSGHEAIFGTVTKVGPTYFTLHSGKTDLTVRTSSKTTYSEPGSKHRSYADIRKGQTLGVDGTTSGQYPNVVSATQVLISPTGTIEHSAATFSSKPVSLGGTVLVVSSGGFTLNSGGTSVAVEVSSSTSYYESGVSAPSLANVANGLYVGVAGLGYDTTSARVQAFAVYITPSTTTTTPACPPTAGDPSANQTTPGTVSDITSDSFVYTSGSTTVTVLLNPCTQIYEGSPTPVGLSVLAVAGTTVTVLAYPDPTSTPSHVVVDARHVYATAPATPTTTTTTPGCPPTAGNPSANQQTAGTASNFTQNSFLFSTGTTTVTVMLNSCTQLFEGSATPQSISAIQVPGTTMTILAYPDPASTTSRVIIDARHIYATAPSQTVAPPNTVAGELGPNLAPTDVTSGGYNVTVNGTTVEIKIMPWTQIYDGGATPVGLSVLMQPGITVGNSGVLDPASTPSQEIVDANHIYVTLPSGG